MDAGKRDVGEGGKTEGLKDGKTERRKDGKVKRVGEVARWGGGMLRVAGK